MNNNKWMKIAIQEAEIAFKENEIPIGAILVKDDKLIFKDHNRTNQLKNKLAHAEKLIIDKAMKNLDETFLYNYTLYVTIEPCTMCAGMIIWSRIGKVVYGAVDFKAGAVGSVYNVLKEASFNHHPELVTGIEKKKCADIIKLFFKKRRTK